MLTERTSVGFFARITVAKLCVPTFDGEKLGNGSSIGYCYMS